MLIETIVKSATNCMATCSRGAALQAGGARIFAPMHRSITCSRTTRSLSHLARLDPRTSVQLACRPLSVRRKSSSTSAILPSFSDPAQQLERSPLTERHVDTVLTSINAASARPGQGFTVVRLSSLAEDPGLLAYLAAAISRVQHLLEVHDTNGDGMMEHSAFDECYERLTSGYGIFSSAAANMTSMDEMCEMDFEAEETFCNFDYVCWVRQLELRQLASMAAGLDSPGAHGLTEEQERQLDELMGCLDLLVEGASTKGVKLLVDAEDVALRPVVEHIAHGLMRRRNVLLEDGASEALVYMTYPAGLPDTYSRLAVDLARAQRQGYGLGAQLVLAGAAADALQSFASCIELLLAAVRVGLAEVMVACSQGACVEAVLALMQAMELDPAEAPVFFSQPLGVADYLSFALGDEGYKVAGALTRG